MSQRALRRAAQRLANKQARPSEALDFCPISEARLAANRANAQLSTGPTSETGKRTSSLNAVKTGLTGHTVLLPSDDAALYETLVHSFIAEFQPQTAEERRYVQSLADTQWRLERIPVLETALFARGHLEFAEKFAAHEPGLAEALAATETMVVYERQLKNLHTQEGRLRRQFAKDLAALQTLLQARRQAEEQAATEQLQAPPEASVGFEFTTHLESLGPADCHAAPATTPHPATPPRTQTAA